MSFLKNYLAKVSETEHCPAAIAYVAALDAIGSADPEIAQCIVQELRDQRKYLKLIASENFSSLPVQLAMGNLLTDKYSEGYAGHRFYAGCGNVDEIERRAVDLAKKIFNAEHAYVQPHSGADANLIAFWAVLVQRIQSKEIERLGKKNLDELSPEEYEHVRRLLVSQKVMGMGLGSGGHLTHGYRHNISSKMMQSVSYEVNPKTGLLDYSALHVQVQKERPFLLIAGYSAYPRLIDFAKMRDIADSVGAVLMVDMAHFSGLVAGKVLQGSFNPIPFAHIVTTTTHKTLRGPRGGMILCTEEFREAVNKGCPLVQGGPLPHVMAAKAIAFQEAGAPAFQKYAHQVVANAKAMAEAFQEMGIKVVTGGTDNHLLLLDARSSFKLTGRQAELLLREAHLTVNRNTIPQDENGPWYTSGVRIGTPAVTTLGMKEKEMREIAFIAASLLKDAKPQMDEKTGKLSQAKAYASSSVLQRSQMRVFEILKHFPLYPEIVI
ncbi:MAG TPA: glycine hydroxymethyltransferase [Chlamydiales bacterium]|nr:glycine hydroxymethyltransferase [Chlamydiales bacterium]